MHPHNSQNDDQDDYLQDEDLVEAMQHSVWGPVLMQMGVSNHNDTRMENIDEEDNSYQEPSSSSEDQEMSNELEESSGEDNPMSEAEGTDSDCLKEIIVDQDELSMISCDDPYTYTSCEDSKRILMTKEEAEQFLKSSSYFSISNEISKCSPNSLRYNGTRGPLLNKTRCLEICSPTSNYIHKLVVMNQDIKIQNLKIFLTSYTQDNLIELKINKTTLKYHDIRLAMKSKSLKNLKRLDLSDSKIEMNSLLAIIDSPNLSNLESLILNRAFKDKKLDYINYYRSYLTHLRILSLEGNDLHKMLVNFALLGLFSHSYAECKRASQSRKPSHFCSIETLNLASCNLDIDDIKTLDNIHECEQCAPFSKLRLLNLPFNKITREEFDEFKGKTVPEPEFLLLS
ncbi:unnamed protein product [Moneuplotes crassus]|uniref:Uncharacterized protein n=1 Tax=Euplotes crassus TaxID=5936 RepID=A0AAD1XDB6_EUPCR|nr:unnamed protein product [Moneuplotes crassus]